MGGSKDKWRKEVDRVCSSDDQGTSQRKTERSMRDMLELGVGATFIRFGLGLGLDLVWTWTMDSGSSSSCYLVARLVIPSRWNFLGLHERVSDGEQMAGGS